MEPLKRGRGRPAGTTRKNYQKETLSLALDVVALCEAGASQLDTTKTGFVEDAVRDYSQRKGVQVLADDEAPSEATGEASDAA